MQIKLITIGTRMPKWITEGYENYVKRLPKDYSLKLIEIPAKKRHKGVSIEKLLREEGQQLLAVTSPQDQIIALERTGTPISTQTLSKKLETWHHQTQNISLLVGGPEGLSTECLQKSREIWSLSPLTLPHGLVRIIVAEQIYRAWSILSHHPYHR